MEANFEYEQVVIPSIYVLFGVWCSAVLSFPAFADMPANMTNMPKASDPIIAKDRTINVLIGTVPMVTSWFR